MNVASLGAAIALGGVLLAGCGDGGAGPSLPATGLIIVPSDTTIQVGRTLRLEVVFLDSTGHRTYSDEPVTWSGSDPAVATISASGVLTAVGVGSTLITAYGEDFGSSASVTVITAAITTRWPLAGGAFGLAVSGASAFVTVPTVNAVAVLRLATESRTDWIPVGDGPSAAALNPSASRLYVSNIAGSSFTVVDAPARESDGNVATPPTPTAVDASRDGKTIWIGSGSTNGVYAYDAGTRLMADSAGGPAGPEALVEHPSLPRLYVSGSGDGRVFELDAETLDSLRAWSLSGSTQGLAISPDGGTLFVANEMGWVNAIDLTTGDVRSSAPLAAGPAIGPFDLAMHPNGQELAVSLGSGTITFLDAATLQVVRTVDTGGRPRRLAYTPTGSRLVVANQAGWVDFIK